MEACRALRPAIVELTGDAADASHPDSCGWVGELGGSASVFASAGRQQHFRPHDGHRWTDAVAATLGQAGILAQPVDFVSLNNVVSHQGE